MNISLTNEYCSASIFTKGAELNSLKNKITETEHIWEGNPAFWGKHSPVLFPIVGALVDNSYVYQEKKYELSRHGFARDFEFKLVEHTTDFASFVLKENTETLLKYPFHFELQIDYMLVDNKLIISYTVRNNSTEEMPFNLGAHPAFALPKSFTDYSLAFEIDEPLVTHELENNVFSGATRTIPLKNKRLPLDYNLFEKDALVFKTIASNTITLLENSKPILKVDFEDFSSLGIWTVRNAHFVCIEPWIGFADDSTSNGNLFEKTNIQVLQPTSSCSVSFSIELL